jgi:hypothetical protein
MDGEIKDVDRLNNGILVVFQDGVVAFFETDFLYAQVEKRVIPSDTASTDR